MKRDTNESNQMNTPSPIIVDSIWSRVSAVLVFAVCMFLLFYLSYLQGNPLMKKTSFILAACFIYLLARLGLSLFYKPVTTEPSDSHKVSVVMPCYNENRESVFKSIDCLMKQDYPLYEIIFVDDGSKDISGYEAVCELKKKYKDHKTKIIPIRYEKNRGKKHAQCLGFERSEGDILMLVDSDGYLYPNAVREMLKPFNDPEVYSVVGHINARNIGDNILTRLQDVLYHSAFRVARAAQSVTNCVLVCSGALSMHRKKIIMENIEEFKKETILGLPNEVGDDRALTNICLRAGGKTKYQSTAVAITDVPTKSKQFFKQQVRWSKSFFLYTIYSMAHAWKRPFMMYWLVCEGFLWILFGIAQILAFLNWDGNLTLVYLAFTCGYFILNCYITSLYYVLRYPLVFMAAPIFSVIHMFFLFPIRIYALLTLREQKWGTR